MTVTLHTLLANYPTTAALKQGRVRSALVDFDFADVRVANTAFKSLVREARFDLGELALVTYLQARAVGKPYVLLPAVVVARSQHPAMLRTIGSSPLMPADLVGRRVGVRAYTQTTGAWLRGILEDDYGVDFRRIQWMTLEEPHICEYTDPQWVTRAPAGSDLRQMLLDGDIDAAIFGNELPDGPLVPLIPHAEDAAASWAARHGGTPINHMVVVRESLAKQRPDVVQEVYRLLLESRNAAGSESIRFGVEPNRQTLQRIIDYSLRQGLIPRALSVDELFDDTTRALEAA